MNKRNSVFVFALLFALTSCEMINTEDGALSTDEVVEGLKTALKIGADSASTSLSKSNGYYLGDIVHIKIPLPKEAEDVRNMINSNTSLASLSSIAGLDQAFEDVIISVNRAAEDAAKEAAPIFSDAITDLSISDGWEILNGRVPDDTSGGNKSADFDSTAATQYLSLRTYSQLTNLYAPKINNSLGKDLIGNISAVDSWNELTSLYNNFILRGDVNTAITIANFAGANINLPDAIETDLGVFSTEKALNGLFYMVGNEEIKIRRDPWQWISTTVGNILTKVFGSVEG